MRSHVSTGPSKGVVDASDPMLVAKAVHVAIVSTDGWL